MKPEFVAHVAQRRARLREQLARCLPATGPLVLEVGSGHGHFLVQYATENPEKFCLGVDLLGERVARAARKADRARLQNCLFVRGEARETIEQLPDATRLHEIWVLFPDPWPKKRHHKNRILQPAFLNFLAARVAKGGRLYFRTDHEEYFGWVGEMLRDVTTWRSEPGAPWPLELATVFQARAPSYQSLVLVRTECPSTPAGTAVPSPSAPGAPTSAG